MEEKTRVFEVEKTIIKEEKDTKRFILKKIDDRWVFHAPDACTFTREELAIIVSKLAILNASLANTPNSKKTEKQT